MGLKREKAKVPKMVEDYLKSIEIKEGFKVVSVENINPESKTEFSFKLSEGFGKDWYSLENNQEEFKTELKSIGRDLTLMVQPESYAFEKVSTEEVWINENGTKYYGIKPLETPPDTWREDAKEAITFYRKVVPRELLTEALKYLDESSKSVLKKLVEELNSKSTTAQTKAKHNFTEEELLELTDSYIVLIQQEIKRLGISPKQSKKKILELSGKSSRDKLNYGDLRRYLEYLKQIPSPQPTSSPKEEGNNKADFIFIQNDNELINAIKSLENEKVLGIDIETPGLSPHLHKLRLIQIASDNHPTIIIDCFKCNAKLIQPILNSDAIKIFHNAKFDLQFFLKLGLEVSQKLFDTQIAYQLITAGNGTDNSCSLKAICKKYLETELNKDEQLSNWASDTLSDKQLKYAARDAEVLLPLREKLILAIRQFGLNRVAKIEFDCILAVAQIEFNGMLLNLEQWQKSINNLETEKSRIETKLRKMLKLPAEENTLFEMEVKINLNSPKQLKEALNNQGFNLQDTEFETLAPLAPDYEVIRTLLEYRSLNKLLTSFGNNLVKKINPITGRIHPSLWQCGASSGRFSCSDPNLQQTPRGKEIRSCFIASPGNKLVIADYSQIELRIAAEIANDEKMIQAYKNNEDLHKLTASLILNKPINEVTKEDRQIAKSANFGLIYGASVKGFRGYAESNYGIKLSEEEAKNIHSNFFKAYKGLAKWHKQKKSEVYVNKNLNETRTLGGRRRFFTNCTLQQALNSPVQGTGADMLKLALSKLPNTLKNKDAKIIFNVHDEIILECSEDSAQEVALILKDCMEFAGVQFLQKVPVIAEVRICDNWSEK